MLQLFGLLSAFLSAICYLPYLRDIFRKTTKPERASWFIWTVLTCIAFFSQLAKGATNSLWLTGVEAIWVTVIFLLSIKYGIGGFKRRDIVALIIAFIGLVLWTLTKDATYALLLTIIVDGTGAVLTILKAYENPASETLSTWLLDGIAGLFAMFAVGSWDFVLLVYPFYIFIINLAVAAAIIVGKRSTKSKRAIIPS